MDEEIRQLERIVSDLATRLAAFEMESMDPVQISRKLQGTFTSGDTAWMLTSTALVLFMTVPGLALYYSGTVQTKNVLATVMQCFSICCVITFCWLCFGYSLSFAPASSHNISSPVYGDESRFWLQGMSLTSWHQLAPTIPEPIFCAYELMFAIITPALIVGSCADRMRFAPMLLFIVLWHFIVYCPIAHSVWHPEGFLYKKGLLDFAGGTVVHTTSGVAGLVAALVLGNRIGYKQGDFAPHNILLTSVGASMLWVGWFGFNAGSALAANERAGMTLLMTQIGAGVASMSWMLTEWIFRRQPSMLGIMSGAVAGLVAITPASGYITATGAFFIGFIAGPVCYAAVEFKSYAGYDDALDAFGIHAVGGILGTLLTGFFATSTIQTDAYGVFYANTKVGGTQLGIQIYGIVVVVGWTLLMSYVILKFIDEIFGLRVSIKEEEIGLDASVHGERVPDATGYQTVTVAEKNNLEIELAAHNNHQNHH